MQATIFDAISSMKPGRPWRHTLHHRTQCNRSWDIYILSDRLLWGCYGRHEPSKFCAKYRCSPDYGDELVSLYFNCNVINIIIFYIMLYFVVKFVFVLSLQTPARPSSARPRNRDSLNVDPDVQTAAGAWRRLSADTGCGWRHVDGEDVNRWRQSSVAVPVAAPRGQPLQPAVHPVARPSRRWIPASRREGRVTSLGFLQEQTGNDVRNYGASSPVSELMNRCDYSQV